MTNFVLTGDAPADDRYRTAAAGLGRTDPLRLLERVKQHHTRWSVAYDLRARTARVVMGSALLLALEQHHNRRFDRGRTLTAVSEGTAKGFFPNIEADERARPVNSTRRSR